MLEQWIYIRGACRIEGLSKVIDNLLGGTGGEDFAALYKSNTVAQAGLVHIGGGNQYADTLRFQLGEHLPKLFTRDHIYPSGRLV